MHTFVLVLLVQFYSGVEILSWSSGSSSVKDYRLDLYTYYTVG